MQASVTARDAIKAIPPACLERSTGRSLAYLLRDLAMFAALAWMIATADHWLIGLPLALVMGTVLTGIFVIGHDCGHRSFSNANWVSDAVGELTLGLTAWPFHVWRLSHDLHHRHTHNIEKDIAWVPFTTAKLGRVGVVARFIYSQTRARLWFLGGWLFTYYFVKDALRGRRSRHFQRQDLPKLRRSVLIATFLTGGYLGAAVWAGGWYGFVCLWLLPMIVFHFWLSTFTLFHHTHPEEDFLPAGAWTFEAQLRKTVHVDFPRAVEWLAHDINWHVPHHACVGIPHYRLRAAHRALRVAFPFVREERFSVDLWRRVTSQCHAITGKDAAGLVWRRQDEVAGLTAVPTTTTIAAAAGEPRRQVTVSNN